MRFPGTSFEDDLLRGAWVQRGRSGWWLKEVGLGYPGERRTRHDRRLDALILVDAPAQVSDKGEDLDEMAEAIAAGRPVELVEAKRELNTNVIGQLLCGLWMFRAKYARHDSIKLAAVVARAEDAALSWYCTQAGIEVVRVDPLSEVPLAD